MLLQATFQPQDNSGLGESLRQIRASMRRDLPLGSSRQAVVDYALGHNLSHYSPDYREMVLRGSARGSVADYIRVTCHFNASDRLARWEARVDR